MTIETQNTLVTIGYWIIWVGLPALLILGPVVISTWPKAIRPTTRGLLIAVVLGWPLLIAYRILVEVPVNMQMAELSADNTYDGVGGNAAMIIMGGLVMLIFATPCAGLRYMIEFWKRRNPQQEASEGHPEAGRPRA